jgi:hypothetical protein
MPLNYLRRYYSLPLFLCCTPTLCTLKLGELLAVKHGILISIRQLKKSHSTRQFPCMVANKRPLPPLFEQLIVLCEGGYDCARKEPSYHSYRKRKAKKEKEKRKKKVVNDYTTPTTPSLPSSTPPNRQSAPPGSSPSCHPQPSQTTPASKSTLPARRQKRYLHPLPPRPRRL